MKSLGLAARSYQIASNLGSRVTGFIDKLANFSGGRVGNISRRAKKEDPDKFDNKGFLKDAESPEQRQKIIDGRIRNLERQTENFCRQIEEKRRKPPAT